MKNLRKRKHEGKYVWTFPQRRNKDNTVYWACQYVSIEDDREKTVTRGLGIPGTAKYDANLAKHERLARESLIERMRNAINNV